MKVILLNLYPEGTLAKYLISSYLLKGYARKKLLNDDISIQVMNYAAEEADAGKICDEINSLTPDCVGFSCYVWNIAKVRAVSVRLRHRLRCIQIFGGPEITFEGLKDVPEEGYADYYVTGEGETVFTDLLSLLNQKVVAENLPGVAFRKDGKLVSRPPASGITDLDTIPSIYLESILEDALYMRQQVFLETQRGCLFKCTYCVYHKNLKGIRYYSLDRVKAELDCLILKKKIYALRIFDAVFTSNLERAKQIVRHIIDLKKNNKISLSWIYWEFSYNCCDDDFLDLVSRLKDHEKISNTNSLEPLDRPQFYSEMLKGYTAVNCVGVQSFHKPTLQAVKKSGGGLEAVKKFMLSAMKYNVVLKIDLILGLPLESFETYIQGLEFFLPFFRGTDHVLNIHRLQILPGSFLLEDCEKYRIDYSVEAPHLVRATGTMSREEMEKAARLTAILFRVFNSPLREKFFQAMERRGCSCMELVRLIHEAVSSDGRFSGIELLRTECLYDTYWNERIFTDIPSSWLLEFLQKS